MIPAKRETLFTSHEVGTLLQMDPSSVVKWVNDGLLPAYRTPGGHRRIRQSDLLAFLRSHGMYVPPELNAGVVRVLVVDDDSALLSALQRSVKSHKDQLEVTTATSGIDALVKVGTMRPDALVIDVHMPDVNGFDVLEQLKSNPDTKSIEVVMMSGKTTAELEKKARSLGAIALLAKPVTATNLVDLLVGPRAGPRAV
jgi:excisionase family DNA binding protein